MGDRTDLQAHLVHGDASTELATLPDEIAHLVVTSPPYWSIKDYGHTDQIGHKDSLSEYLDRLGEAWSRCYRLLYPGCRMAVNIGDQYHSSAEIEGKPYHITPLGSHILQSVMDACDDVLFLGTIIWQKVSNTQTSGGASVMGSFGRPRNGYVSFDYEYIHLFKKPGSAPEPTCKPEEQAAAEIDLENWRDLFSGHWSFPGAKQDDHPAPFPEELPRRLLTMFTYPDDLVLDPFMGAGTTPAVANQMGRRYIGIELNEEFYDTARTRCSQQPLAAFADGGTDV